MRPWAWARRVLALLITIVFVLGVVVTPAFAAKSRSFSAPKSGGFSSGSRSFSTPKSTTPSTPSRSFSQPKSTTPTTPSRSFSTPAPSTTQTPSPSYSTPTSPSYSGSDRSYSGPSRSFSSQRPSGGSATVPAPAPSYDTTKTRYPTLPPVVVYGPSTYDGGYWHDWYYGRPWYWRMWHRPVYYGTTGGWGMNWWPIIIFGGIGLWVLLGVLSAYSTRRRRM